MTDLTAALGLAQVRRWDELTTGRRRVGDRYAAAGAVSRAVYGLRRGTTTRRSTLVAGGP